MNSPEIVLVMPLAEQRGGAELALLHLLEHGRGLGVGWSVVFLEDGPMVERVRGLGVEATVIEAGRLRQVGRMAKTVREIARHVRRSGAEAVLSWMGKAQLYGGPAAKLAGVEGVWFQMGLAHGWMDKLATRMPTSAILACSHFAANRQADLKPHRNILSVQLGAELDRFDQSRLPPGEIFRKDFNLPMRGPIIGIAGRLQSWKGMHILLDAMPAVLQTHPDATCLVVGGEHKLEADYADKLRAQVERLGLGERVIFAGHQTNVPQWMQAMDVIVHASDREPFGMVVVEAMAMGKPVVASIPGGPAEVITDGVDGQLVEFGDAEALGKAVCRYLDEPAFAKRCGAAAKRRARDFSAQAFARRVCEAMRELTGNGDGVDFYDSNVKPGDAASPGFKESD